MTSVNFFVIYILLQTRVTNDIIILVLGTFCYVMLERDYHLGITVSVVTHDA